MRGGLGKKGSKDQGGLYMGGMVLCSESRQRWVRDLERHPRSAVGWWDTLHPSWEPDWGPGAQRWAPRVSAALTEALSRLRPGKSPGASGARV